MNKSAASAAATDNAKCQAVIKLADSAASPRAKSRKPRPRGAPGQQLGMRLAGLGALLWVPVPSIDMAFGEAALAADLITA